MSTDILKSDLVKLLPRLRRYAMTLTGNPSEADELVQEVCLRALSRAHQWDTSQPLARWVFRITHNMWISETRKRKVRTGQGTVQANETVELKTITTGESTTIASEIGKTVLSLPPDLANTLLMVTVEGYSYKEAAAHFDVPIGTIMSRISRARSALRIKLAA